MDDKNKKIQMNDWTYVYQQAATYKEISQWVFDTLNKPPLNQLHPAYIKVVLENADALTNNGYHSIGAFIYYYSGAINPISNDPSLCYCPAPTSDTKSQDVIPKRYGTNLHPNSYKSMLEDFSKYQPNVKQMYTNLIRVKENNTYLIEPEIDIAKSSKFYENGDEKWQYDSTNPLTNLEEDHSNVIRNLFSDIFGVSAFCIKTTAYSTLQLPEPPLFPSDDKGYSYLISSTIEVLYTKYMPTESITIVKRVKGSIDKVTKDYLAVPWIHHKGRVVWNKYSLKNIGDVIGSLHNNVDHSEDQKLLCKIVCLPVRLDEQQKKLNDKFFKDNPTNDFYDYQYMVLIPSIRDNNGIEYK